MPISEEWTHFYAPYHTFFSGATSALCLVAALLFLRFYRKTVDRLFLFFAAAFALLGINRFFVLMLNDHNEKSYLYLIRLLAFSLIIYAILDKNRSRTRS